MQDLQVGFSAAMDELSKIQDEDRELQDKLESSNKHHDDQLAEILQTVQALKVIQGFRRPIVRIRKQLITREEISFK